LKASEVVLLTRERTHEQSTKMQQPKNEATLDIDL